MTGSKQVKTWGSIDTFEVEIYKAKWHFIFCDDLDEHLKELLSANGMSELQISEYKIGSNTNGCVFLVDEKDWYFCMFDIRKFSVGLAVHEAFHVAKMILFERGVKLEESISTEEPYAYLLEYLTTKIMEFHKKRLPEYKQYKKDKKDAVTSRNTE